MNLPFSVLELSYSYDLPCPRVYEWWTELEPKGYVGRRLTKMDVLTRSEDHAVVLTHWVFMGIRFSMEETLEIRSSREWVWHSKFLGVPAVETFQLKESGNGCMLQIHSEMRPQSTLRKIMFLLIGWFWRREDRREWNEAYLESKAEIRPYEN